LYINAGRGVFALDLGRPEELLAGPRREVGASFVAVFLLFGNGVWMSLPSSGLDVECLT
jgi:hypothetical protein